MIPADMDPGDRIRRAHSLIELAIAATRSDELHEEAREGLDLVLMEVRDEIEAVAAAHYPGSLDDAAAPIPDGNVSKNVCPAVGQ